MVYVFFFRYLVTLCGHPQDTAKDFLRTLGANENVLKQSDQLYNKKIKNKNSLYFNRRLYDEQFFGKYDCSIDVLIDLEDTSEFDTVGIKDHKKKFFTKRINQIDSYVVNIEPTLESIKARINIVTNQIEACTECCHLDYSIRSGDQSLEMKGIFVF